MKFGKELAKLCVAHPRCKNFFLNYKELKRSLNNIDKQHGDRTQAQRRSLGGPRLSQEEEAQAQFKELLRHELEKINNFVELQYEVINGELKAWLRLTSEGRREIEERDISKLDKLASDIATLDVFIQANFTGFQKIVKKCDKRCGTAYMSWFMPNVEAAPFRQWDLDVLKAQLDKLRSRQGGSSGGPPQLAPILETPSPDKAEVVPDAGQASVAPSAVEKAPSSTGFLSKSFNDCLVAFGLKQTSGQSQAATADTLLRVEVKTPLANERTLLRWLRSAVLLSTLSAFLSSGQHPASQVNGLLMAGVSLLFVFWPAGVFWQRSSDLAKVPSKQPVTDKTLSQVLAFALITILASVLIIQAFVEAAEVASVEGGTTNSTYSTAVR
mmetsp:Transcript_68538/g.107144  ORF Transcript_68538/g.107144 Transcript_68538/m.107144 type:complete len:384 (+) Transcript_68538:106-1257(+)